MQSLLRAVGRPASFCRRRSLFSALYSTRVGSSSPFEARLPGRSPGQLPLPATSRRACSSVARMSSSASHPEYRLPPSAKPTHYDLTVRTNLENQTFDGFVEVQCVTDLI
jgi:hypothetical protein